MAVLKCKMCGGDLNVSGGEKIVECEFCGTTQTVPDGNDEKKTNLFNRANRLRTDNEFDKAAGIYESIIAEFPNEAEGYWGLVLCNYGIEYVDDAKTGKKIPTCHRTLSYSVMDDDNFIQACENADVVARGIYREEAKAIDKLQKQIIAIAESEEPYDVFICYKETDDITKSRTEDSQLAQDIYTELIKEGYNVFFSRVTLREKAGTEYEPYIYAALKSAKVMLAIGTKYDYYDAVWVKNEWSRYISMMSENNSKHLIPCYKNLDAYDIPKEFKNRQALDMGEVTFFKNLIDNVERFIPKAKQGEIKVEQVVSSPAGGTTDALLKRAFMFLEDGDFESADEYCEKVLDINPECAQAYLGKLMSELEVHKQDDLQNCEKPFDDSLNYQKTMRFADDDLKNKLAEDIDYINKRNKAAEIEEVYQDGVSCMSEAMVENDFIIAAELFEEIKDYKDSAELAKKCRENAIVAKKQAEIEKEKLKPIIEKNCIKQMYNPISAGTYHTMGLKSDGTVLASDFTNKTYYQGQCDVSDWTDIVAISAANYHSVGLKTDGTVVSTKHLEFKNKNFGDCSIAWYDHGQYNVNSWSDIIAISTGDLHTVGLKSNGTVVATGDNQHGQCNIQNWKDIIAISASGLDTVGLKTDGSVVITQYVGDTDFYDSSKYSALKWPSVVAISNSATHIVGLKADGTVLSTGADKYEIYNWTNIISVAAGDGYTIGLKSNGTVVSSKYFGAMNDMGQCDVSNWMDIVAISVGSSHTVGLKSDGTVVATGHNRYGQCNLNNFYGISPVITAETLSELKIQKEKLSSEGSKKREQQRIMADYRNSNLCQHCGGAFKGLFTKICSKCGKKKDY